jgi:hypothetical protein
MAGAIGGKAVRMQAGYRMETAASGFQLPLSAMADLYDFIIF